MFEDMPAIPQVIKTTGRLSFDERLRSGIIVSSSCLVSFEDSIENLFKCIRFLHEVFRILSKGD
jgi:hypothetical protein